MGFRRFFAQVFKKAAETLAILTEYSDDLVYTDFLTRSHP
jgi:hypothetical protein